MTPAQQRGTCVDSVLLEPLINRDSKTLIWITAKDKNSGQSLESQVKLGKIDKISINVNYKHFYVGDKKHVDLVAFDDQGNIFSGLEGFRFDWSIQSGTQHIKIIPKPEGYDHPSKGTEETYVMGLTAGSAELKVQILEPFYDNDVASTSVTFMVVDPFIVEPSKPIFVLPTSEFKLSLSKLIKLGGGVVNKENITLPSPQYLWSLPADDTLGTISQDGTFVSRVTEGKQNIFVVDQQMTNNTSEGQINIVFPYKIQMRLKDITDMKEAVPSLKDNIHNSYFKLLYGDKNEVESDSNILIEDRIYLVQLSLSDKDENVIQLTKNIRFETEGLFASGKIKKLKVNHIGSEIVFQTTQISEEQLRIKTTYRLSKIIPAREEVFSIEGRELLKVDAEFILTKPVEIMNPTNLILLPYLPNGEIWQVSAKGGSGVYSWSILNPQIASVEGSAVVKSLKIGKTKLQLQDHRNKQNFATIDVEVASVNQLKWLEDHIELKNEAKSSAGESSVISLIALDRAGRKFSNCTSLDSGFEIKGEGNLVALQNKSSYESIRKYVHSEAASLLNLKQKFDENPSKVYAQDLPKGQARLKPELIQYNNFGICSQTQIQAAIEGLGRVKATSKILLESGQQSILESEFAEFAVFKPLSTLSPQVSSFSKHLYSKSQVGQEFANFDNFYTQETIKLLPGTEMEWIVEGGSNFWQDYQGKYAVEWQVNPRQQPANNSTVTLTKLSEAITRVQMKIQCLVSPNLQQINRLNVVLTQSSKQSRQLLRPANHQIVIQVDCGAPKSAKLLWSQPTDNVTVNLPNSRLVQDERTHFVLMGSKHFVETLLLDDQQTCYLNSSSVATTVVVSDAKLAVVNVTDKKFTEAVKENRQAKREIHFANQTGRLQLRSTSSGYHKQMLIMETTSYALFSTEQKDSSGWYLGPVSPFHSQLVDDLNIEVVKNVEVEPKTKSVYIGSTKEFKLTINEGSGHFSVSINDPELAQVTHKDRGIFVLPKKPGQLQITVEDLLVPDADTKTSSILISDIERVFLWSPHTLIEQGNSMSLSVTAIDSDNKEFDFDQYTDMKFEIETEMTAMNKELGLRTEPTKVNTEFIAFGNEAGIYQVTAYSSHFKPSIAGKSTVVSEMLKIEVFPLLEIFPTQLLLTPSMRYTLQIVGGPQSSVLSFQNGSSVEIKFEIDDQQIASIDLNREVTAHQVGNATLKYQIIQQRGQRGNPYRRGKAQDEQPDYGVVSKKQVPIRVRIVTDIEIPLNNKRLIYSDTLIKLNVVPKFGQEYFTNGIAPISYSWNCSQNQVLNLEVPSNRDSLPTGTTNSFIQKSKKLRNNVKNDDNFVFTSVFNSSSIYARAGKDGDAPISVTLAIEYPVLYKNHQNVFQTSVTVKVASRLSVQVNKDSTSSQESFTMFLLPPNSVGFIKANLNTKLKLGYSIVSVYDRSTGTHRSEEATTPLVKLVDNQAIQTFDKYGKVTVVIEQGGQSFSDQIVMLNVFIADIFSLQVMNGYDALTMPLGSQLKLPIHFQNEHANRFVDNIKGPRIAFSLSHPKVVDVEVDSFAQTLTLVTQGQGDCNILVYLESNPSIFDVVRVRVSSIVRPLSPVILHVGGVVNFKVINPDEGNSEFQQPDQGAQWVSSDNQVLTIDSDTGRAYGRSEGRTDVILSNHVNAASLVHIGRIQFGQIEHKNPFILNTDEKQSTSSSGGYDILRVRVKLFFMKDGEEVMPTLKYSGITLIQQNIGLSCATNQSDFISVEPLISDLEGYFCVISYKKNSNHRFMPRFAKIVVSAYSLHEGSTLPIYTTDVAQFEVQLLSSIKVENKFKNGVQLSGSQRSEQIHIFSSSEFVSQIKQEDEDLTDSLKLEVTREDINSNDYTLKLVVVAEVDYDFSTTVVLTHPYTKIAREIPVSFTYTQPSQKKVKKSTKAAVKAQDPDYEEMPRQRKSDQKSSSGFGSYLLLFFVLVVTVSFVDKHLLRGNIFGLFGNQRRDGDDGGQILARRRQQGMQNNSQIRQPQMQAYKNRNVSYQSSNFGNANSLGNSQAQHQRSLNLAVYDQNRRNVGAQNSAARQNSIYSSNSPY